MNAPDLKAGMLVWWMRRDPDNPNRRFETLAKVAGEATPQAFRPDRLEVPVTWLAPARNEGESPIVAQRNVDPYYLTPFIPGDARVWERISKIDNTVYGVDIKVLGVDEKTGLVLAACRHCPHTFTDGTVTQHRIRPRYVQNGALLAGRNNAVAAPPTRIAVRVRDTAAAPAERGAAVPAGDNYATKEELEEAMGGLGSDMKTMANAVLAITDGKHVPDMAIKHLAEIANGGRKTAAT